MDKEEKGIVFPSEIRDSERGIAFRDKTPLHRTVHVVCAGHEINMDGEKTGGIVFLEPLDVRWYWGSGDTCRCIVWFRDSELGRYGSGVGRAGGYGYDKVFASFLDALHDLGIRGIDRYGEMFSIDKVCKAIAGALGYKYIYIVEGHR